MILLIKLTNLTIFIGVGELIIYFMYKLPEEITVYNTASQLLIVKCNTNRIHRECFVFWGSSLLLLFVECGQKTKSISTH